MKKSKDLDVRLKQATAAALEAGRFIATKFGKFRKLSEKSNQSLVTEADKGAEAIILKKLRKLFPDDHYTGEETGVSKGRNEFHWHIDPLDGTTNFVHAFPIFCVSIGLEVVDSKGASEIILGVIYHPITKDLYTAQKGKGAFKNGKRMRVSKRALLRDALFSTGFSVDVDKYRKAELRNLEDISNTTRGIRRTGSAALDLTFVATGQFDGFWERGLAAWDVAAGIALVQEAGGFVSQLSGKPHALDAESIVATNGLVHGDFLQVLGTK